MDFYTWDTLVRTLAFGGIFLVSLFLALWIWYDTSISPHERSWWWRIGGSLLVVGTAPAVVLGAANLDQDRRDLLTMLAWLAIAAGVASLLTTVAYIVWGRAASDAPTPADRRPPSRPPDTIPAFGHAGVRGAGPAPTIVGAPGARAEALVADAYLFVKAGRDKGRQFSLAEQATIGRGDNCTIVLSDRRVSNEHAQVKREPGGYVFLDLQSSNGSFLVVGGEDRPLRTAQVLVHGDEIRMGHTVLEFIHSKAGDGR